MELCAFGEVPRVLALAPSHCHLERSERSAPSDAGFLTAFEMTGGAFEMAGLTLEMTGAAFEMTEKAHR